MKIFNGLVVAIFLIVGQVPLSAGASTVAFSSGVSSSIERFLSRISEETEPDAVKRIQGDPLLSPVLLIKFYEGRSYWPAWTEGKSVGPMANDLLNALRQSDREGLNPDDYHLWQIKRIIQTIESDREHCPPYQYADLDLLLTDAFLAYGSHLLSGRINPYSVDDEWFLNRRTGDLHEILESVIASEGVRNTLEELLPAHPVYHRMRDALARYRTLEKNGGWPFIPGSEVLKRRDQNDRVPLLKKRLHIEGYLHQRPNDKLFFDEAVERALIQFQKDHGLEPDGILGEFTLAALNVPAEQRVHQLRINMERCRWLPADMGARHILVNVPEFGLRAIEYDKPVLEMKVIVGRKMRRTPVFSSRMNQIVLNPSWTVPMNVATKDILTHILEEPDYLQKNNFEVYEGYDENAVPVDPATIQWSSVTAQNLNYKFRQKPGLLNALGQVKFLFPNRFDVYLHDTPSRSLFEKLVRDFSSGCIRVQKPIELAEYLLKHDPFWTRDMLLKTLQKGVNEQYIVLKDPVPVHLIYWTAWVDERDHVQFRDDLYGRDNALDQALHRGGG